MKFPSVLIQIEGITCLLWSPSLHKGGNDPGNKDLDVPSHVSKVGTEKFHWLWKILGSGFMSTTTSIQHLTQQDARLAEGHRYAGTRAGNLITNLLQIYFWKGCFQKHQWSQKILTGRRKERMFSSLQISKGFLNNGQESVKETEGEQKHE